MYEYKSVAFRLVLNLKFAAVCVGPSPPAVLVSENTMARRKHTETRSPPPLSVPVPSANIPLVVMLYPLLRELT